MEVATPLLPSMLPETGGAGSVPAACLTQEDIELMKMMGDFANNFTITRCESDNLTGNWLCMLKFELSQLVRFIFLRIPLLLHLLAVKSSDSDCSKHAQILWKLSG